jgi:gamma-glutamyltranspeptidase/glutathione hydrolase
MMGMVVAPQAMASEIGANVLATGGNAVDAAVAVAFVQGVLDPVNCGIGGFGCMVVYGNDGSCRTLSFHATAGSRVEEGMWEGLIEDEYRGSGGDGFRLRGFVNSVGYQSIATPGTARVWLSKLELSHRGGGAVGAGGL